MSCDTCLTKGFLGAIQLAPKLPRLQKEKKKKKKVVSGSGPVVVRRALHPSQCVSGVVLPPMSCDTCLTKGFLGAIQLASKARGRTNTYQIAPVPIRGSLPVVVSQARHPSTHVSKWYYLGGLATPALPRDPLGLSNSLLRREDAQTHTK